LIDEIFSGIGQSEFKSFFYVGDTKQSLYRFRGGVEELFDAVAQHYGITVSHMDTNYRSSRSVVEQVNRWFEPNLLNFPPAKCREGAKEGYVEVIESEALVEEAICQIERYLGKGVSLNSIAVLVSTNKDGTTLQEACYAKGIITSLKTSSSLKHTPKVASVMRMVSYLFYGLELDAKALLERVDKKLDEVNFSWFNPFMEPLTLIHKIISCFGYFENDLNLLKLLEFSAQFSDIATLIEEFEFSSIEVASSSKNGAMIMTIHGSKGLEFEHVIVLDRLKGLAPDNATLLYAYDASLHIKEIFYKIGGRENFDKEYKKLLEKQKRLKSKDKMNILYVALTRAVESMIVIRKPKASLFDPLGITPMSIGIPPSKPLYSTPKDTHLKEKIVITHYGVQEVTKEEKDEDKDYEALLFGSALHYLLEMMRHFSVSDLPEALNAMINRYGEELNKEKIEAIEHRALALIQNQQFQELLHGATIAREQSLAFENSLKQIDLLLTYPTHCVVIDYKSSKKYHRNHITQVRSYKRAIETILGKETKGVILYLLESGIEFFEC